MLAVALAVSIVPLPASAEAVTRRPARRTESAALAQARAKSINQTFKAQLDLERHGGRTIDGVITRVLQRILALTAAIWHNHHTGQPVIRSLTAYDH